MTKQDEFFARATGNAPTKVLSNSGKALIVVGLLAGLGSLGFVCVNYQLRTEATAAYDVLVRRDSAREAELAAMKPDKPTSGYFTNDLDVENARVERRMQELRDRAQEMTRHSVELAESKIQYGTVGALIGLVLVIVGFTLKE